MKKICKVTSILLMSFLLFSCGKKSKTKEKYFDATFVDYDESLLYKTSVKEGDVPVYSLTTPTRSNDDNYSYTFSGWSPELSEIHSDTTYVAQYDKTDLPYTISFNLDGGTSTSDIKTIKTDKFDKSLFSFDVKKKDYIFVGWSYRGKLIFDSKGNTVKNVTIESSMEFKAMYEEVLIYSNYGTTINGIKDKNITEVTIPDGVESINSNAFKDCKYLKEIIIPKSTTYIRSDAFNGCNSLSSIKVDENNTVYDSRNNCNAIIEKSTNKLIVGCKATNILNGIKIIGSDAFKDCISLESIIIPESVTSIEGGAFTGCSSLSSIKVDENNTVYDSRNNCNAIIKTYNDQLIVGCKNTIIPEDIKEVGYDSFKDCTSLESITIPESVTSIDGRAFSGCSSLYSIIVDKNNTVYDSRNNCNAIIDTENNILIIGCKSTIIPNSVIEINSEAFKDCTSLESITIPESVEQIDNMAFAGCISLKTVNLNNGIKTIDFRTFKDCKSLESIIIPDSVTNIDNNAFEGCTSLESITIPESVTVIGDGAFDGCTSLKTVNLNNGLEKIGFVAFEKCTSLESITIPESVTNIDGRVFTGCSSLSSIIVDENNTVYDSRNNCNAIIETANNKLIYGCKSTIIPNSVIEINSEAFKDCTSLESITIPDSVTNIDNNAFEGCTSLKTVNLNNGLEKIGFAAFNNCTSLESIIIPESVTSIDGRVFTGCSSLSNIIVDENNTVYDSRNNCNAIIEKENNIIIVGCKSTIIPNSVIEINSEAFKDCTSLDDLIIPKTVTRIELLAFKGCGIFDIFYTGTSIEWNEAINNDTIAIVYFYSETKPTIAGNYWHYVDGIPKIWITE